MQIPDTVIYNNDVAYETGVYCADLFEPYLEKHHIELFADCSALWRGYIYCHMENREWYAISDRDICECNRR